MTQISKISLNYLHFKEKKSLIVGFIFSNKNAFKMYTLILDTTIQNKTNPIVFQKISKPMNYNLKPCDGIFCVES